MTEPVEIVETETAKVACNGDGGALGHPRVYLAIDETRETDCPYCGRRFTRKAGVELAAGGH